MKRALPSILAAVLTPIALLFISAATLGQLDDLSNPLRVIVIAATVLFAVGISLLKPISPRIYALASLPVWLALAWLLYWIGSGGELAGKIVLGVIGYGVLLAGTVAGLGTFLRAKKLPGDLKAGIILTAVLISVAAGSWVWWVRVRQSVTIVERLEEIRRAEFAYAASRPDHGFTCNGPDLPGFGNLVWETDPQLGLPVKSRTHIDGHLVWLTCPFKPAPNWVEIVARSYTGRISVVRANQ